MGCDIHCQAERRIDGEWAAIPGPMPLDCRSYRLFGFLAGVRNYSAVPPISEARGLPPDVDYDEDRDGERWLGEHSFSWLSLDELTAFDYEQVIEDRRVTRQQPNGVISGGETGRPGEGVKLTYREFLGGWYFEELRKLEEVGAERIVFGFDS